MSAIENVKVSALVHCPNEKSMDFVFVVEASIFNFNAELPRVEERKGVPLTATCRDSDLRPLAETALRVHKELGRSNFAVSLVEAMKKEVNDLIGQDDHVSAFTYILEDGADFAQQSKVVTSWTIKTDIKGTSFASNARNVDEIFRFVLLFMFAGAISLYTALRTRRNPRVKEEIQDARRKSSGSSRRRHVTTRHRGKKHDHHHLNDDFESLISKNGINGRQKHRELEDASIGSLSTYLARTHNEPIR